MFNSLVLLTIILSVVGAAMFRVGLVGIASTALPPLFVATATAQLAFAVAGSRRGYPTTPGQLAIWFSTIAYVFLALSWVVFFFVAFRPA
jgi:hypothetical protein